MATAFKEKERKEITERIKNYAIKRAAEVGMKKTSIDSIVDYACISKGAFYNFYDSKDALFLEIVEDWHTQIYAMALKCLISGTGSNKERAANALYEACNILYNEGIMKFYLKDLPHLLKNIFDTPLVEHYHDDSVHINEVIKYSGVELVVSQNEAVSIVKNIAYMVLNADSLCEEYWSALRIIIDSVCSSIVK
ncbi:hypothetical protein SDC9_107904 [bioreactor metagenome]|uniref:HTH tetR-type domain-containing protein n=1 Tax=bioreactor metagenome TaxID=1076179 RepID=A0A645B6I9_9ZZZZ|nr:TetR/AcrR family transcriptional regulator [Candidatus Metalachnospira sp.]